MYIYLTFFFLPAFERNLFSVCLRRENLQWKKKVNGEIHTIVANSGTQGNLKLFLLSPFLASVLHFSW